MLALRLRDATLADLDAVEALETAVFTGDALSRRSLRYYLTAPTARFLVLEAGPVLIGDALVGFRRNATVARLYSIAIRPEAAGRGHGRRLLAACEAAAGERGQALLRLEVRSDNPTAIKLYERAGYDRFGVYPDYYEDGMSALRFQKRLAPA